MWVRVLTIVTGLYNFVFVGGIIRLLSQIAITALGLNDSHILPIPIARFVAGIVGMILIVHSVRLIMGIEANRVLQLWICGTAVLYRLSMFVVFLAVPQQTSMSLLHFVFAAMFMILLFDLPLFLAFRTPRVKASFARAEANRRERQQYREFQKLLKL